MTDGASASRPPRLTAVVVVGPLRHRGERCLAALLAQSALDELEIVLIDVAGDRGRLDGADHPRVRWIPRPEIASYSTARAEGARLARGEFVAFLEDHVIPRPAWAAALLEAFERPVAVVNYAFANANPESYASRASFLVEYGPWMAPARRGPITYVASNNIAYRKSVLDFYLHDLDTLLDVEFILHRKIRSTGATIWLEPDAIVEHENWVSLADVFRSNAGIKRVIVNTRAIRSRWGRGRRLVFAAGMVLYPPLFLWRLVRTLILRPVLWPSFIVGLPIVVAVPVYVAFAEAGAYLFGIGGAEKDYMRFELVADRQK